MISFKKVNELDHCLKVNDRRHIWTLATAEYVSALLDFKSLGLQKE